MKAEILSEKRWESLSAREQDTYARVLDAVRIARADGLSLSAAARRAGTSPATVKRYAGSAFELRSRKFAAREADRLYRRVHVLTTDGRREVGLRGSRAASTVSGHWRAVDAYLKGDEQSLHRYRDRRVGGFVLETDLDAIEAAADREEVRFEDLYAEAA
ncbi:MAG: hypothetical protein ACJ757_02155 [Gaiellaceae bacterium]